MPAGAGYIPAAAIAAALILAAHLGLRPVARRVDRLPASTETEVETSYRFQAVCRAGDQAHIRVLVVQALTRLEPSVSSVSWNSYEPAVLTAAEE